MPMIACGQNTSFLGMPRAVGVLAAHADDDDDDDDDDDGDDDPFSLASGYSRSPVP